MVMQDCDDLTKKRLFFGLEIEASWPEKLPPARILAEEQRHMTLAFLGNIPFEPFESQLETFPLPPFRIAPVGVCDHFLFLPEQTPRVVAGHVTWLNSHSLDAYLLLIKQWLLKNGYKVDERTFLPHISIARDPFTKSEWEKMFSPFPIVAKALHLYETVACLTYQPLWSIPFPSPFEEIEHTADIAFIIRGIDINQLYLHAQIALAFKFPHLLNYIEEDSEIQHLDMLIMRLNALIARADCEIGCPFKAISFHGEISHEPKGLLHWEMIVDV